MVLMEGNMTYCEIYMKVGYGRPPKTGARDLFYFFFSEAYLLINYPFYVSMIYW